MQSIVRVTGDQGLFHRHQDCWEGWQEGEQFSLEKCRLMDTVGKGLGEQGWRWGEAGRHSLPVEP